MFDNRRDRDRTRQDPFDVNLFEDRANELIDWLVKEKPTYTQLCNEVVDLSFRDRQDEDEFELFCDWFIMEELKTYFWHCEGTSRHSTADFLHLLLMPKGRGNRAEDLFVFEFLATIQLTRAMENYRYKLSEIFETNNREMIYFAASYYLSNYAKNQIGEMSREDIQFFRQAARKYHELISDIERFADQLLGSNRRGGGGRNVSMRRQSANVSQQGFTGGRKMGSNYQERLGRINGNNSNNESGVVPRSQERNRGSVTNRDNGSRNGGVVVRRDDRQQSGQNSELAMIVRELQACREAISKLQEENNKLREMTNTPVKNTGNVSQERPQPRRRVEEQKPIDGQIVTAKLPLINAQGVAPINSTNYLQMLKSKMIHHPYLVDLTSNLFFALKPNGDHTMLTRQELALPPELIDQKGTYALSGGSFKATEEKSLAQARKEVTYEFVQLPFDCKHVFFRSSVIGKYLPKKGEHKFPISISSGFRLLSKNETTSFENDKKVFDLIVKLKESVDPIGDLWYLLHTWFFKPETLPNCFSSTVYQQIEEMITVGFNKTVALYMGLPFCRITNFGPRTKEDKEECSYEDFANGLEKRFGSMYASVIKSKEFFNILINMMFFKTPETDAIIAKGKEDGLLEGDVFYSQRLAFKNVHLVNQQNFADLLMEGLVFTYFKDECVPSMLLKETHPLLHRFAEEAYMTNVGNIDIELPLIIYLPKGKLYVSRSLLNNALLVTYLESGKVI